MSEEEQFKVGDQVCLKGTTSPVLTIEKINFSFNYLLISVCWFNINNVLQRAVFTESILKKYELYIWPNYNIPSKKLDIDNA